MRVAVAMLVVGCGGRTALSEGLGGGDGGLLDSAADVPTDTEDGGPFDPCLVQGVRLCGPGCSPVGTPECCAAVRDRETDEALVAGVCWTDLSDTGQRPCAGCRDGEVCVERAPGSLVCVPFDICRALALLGSARACRYADKSAYDGSPLAPGAATCPNDTNGHSLRNAHMLCGGDCGDCVPGRPCIGRSPSRPLGVCGSIDIVGGGSSEDRIKRCATAADCGFVHASCAVFHVAPEDQPAADQYGNCNYDCETAAGAVGLFCR